MYMTEREPDANKEHEPARRQRFLSSQSLCTIHPYFLPQVLLFGPDYNPSPSAGTSFVKGMITEVNRRTASYSAKITVQKHDRLTILTGPKYDVERLGFTNTRCIPILMEIEGYPRVEQSFHLVACSSLPKSESDRRSTSQTHMKGWLPLARTVLCSVQSEGPCVAPKAHWCKGWTHDL